jgi:hypothetical protein
MGVYLSDCAIIVWVCKEVMYNMDVNKVKEIIKNTYSQILVQRLGGC